MEFSCSICSYRTDKKANIERHINNKRKCGIGTPIIIEIPVTINCNFCKKTFTTVASMKRHLKICKIKKEQTEEEIAKKDEQIRELKEKLAEASKKIINNTTNNTNIINNNFITVQLRPYNDPKLPEDMDDIYEDAWSKKKSISTFIERIHFNPDLPENHNICITNLKSKLVKVFTEQGWVTKDQDNIINEIIITTDHLMEKWVNAKKSRQEYKNSFFEYLGQVGRKFISDDNVQELLFYNGHQSGMVNIKSSTKEVLPILDEY